MHYTADGRVVKETQALEEPANKILNDQFNSSFNNDKIENSFLKYFQTMGIDNKVRQTSEPVRQTSEPVQQSSEQQIDFDKLFEMSQRPDSLLDQPLGSYVAPSDSSMAPINFESSKANNFDQIIGSYLTPSDFSQPMRSSMVPIMFDQPISTRTNDKIMPLSSYSMPSDSYSMQHDSYSMPSNSLDSYFAPTFSSEKPMLNIYSSENQMLNIYSSEKPKSDEELIKELLIKEGITMLK